MDDKRISNSGEVPDTVPSPRGWDEKMSAVKENGLRMAKHMREQNKPFVVEILAPQEVKGGDTVPLSAVVIHLDWKIATRLKMVESARDLITNAYIVDSLDPVLPTVLKSIIEGKGLYAHSIGEFFQLYGKFEGKYHLTNGTDTKDKMESLVNGDARYLKPYKVYGKSHPYPLPYAVRNILAHTGQNPNTLDTEGKELRTSIELLRSWVTPEK